MMLWLRQPAQAHTHTDLILSSTGPAWARLPGLVPSTRAPSLSRPGAVCRRGLSRPGPALPGHWSSAKHLAKPQCGARASAELCTPPSPFPCKSPGLPSGSPLTQPTRLGKSLPSELISVPSARRGPSSLGAEWNPESRTPQKHWRNFLSPHAGPEAKGLQLCQCPGREAAQVSACSESRCDSG